MTLGPMIRRELVTSARRWATYSGRASWVLMVFAIMAVCSAAWSWTGADRDTLAGRSRFCLVVFISMVSIQAWVTMLMVLSDVATLLPAERERKTLDALLSTQLSSTEIVFGTLGSGMIKQSWSLVVVFPMMLAMIPIGGIDPRLVFWAYAGIFASMFAMAAIAMASSIGFSNRRQAVQRAAVLGFTWLMAPFLILVFAPRFGPAWGNWLIPPASLMLDTSPLGVITNAMGIIRRRGLIEQIVRMIGAELLLGSLLLVWAIVRFRSACRAAYDGEYRSYGLFKKRARGKRWPACGDRPVFWRERHVLRGSRGAEWYLAYFINLSVLVGLVFMTYRFAEPAFRDLFAHGYRTNLAAVSASEVNPIASIFLARGGISQQPGTARVEFNVLIRMVCGVFALGYVLVVAGFGAEGVAVERVRDTWSGLIATPLRGREIIQDKIFAAIWRVRVALVIVVLFWLVGLLSGSLHPLGFAAALAELAVTTWFFSAFGTYCSLISRDLNQANSRVLLPSIIFAFSAILLRLLPVGNSSVYVGALSVPFRLMLILVSYGDVKMALSTGAFPYLASIGVETGEGAARVLVIYLSGLILQVFGALFFTRAAYRRFDEAVGRPIRGKSPRPLPTVELAHS